MHDNRNSLTKGMEYAISALAKYEHLLAAETDLWSFPRDGELIPAEVLPALVDAINAGLQPATSRQVAEFVAMIAGAWPYGHQKVDQAELDLHVRQLAEDLSEFPADILVATVKELRRTLRFAPSIAEAYEMASNLRWRRKRQLLVIEQHRQEHRRRAAEAAQEAKRKEERRGALQKRFDHMKARYGEAMAGHTITDVEAMSSGAFLAGFHMLVDWTSAVEEGDPWVARAMPLLLVAGRARPLHEAGQLSAAQLCRLLAAALRDPAAALAVVAAIGAQPGPAGSTRLPAWLTAEDTEAPSTDPRGYLASLIAEIRGGASAQPISGDRVVH